MNNKTEILSLTLEELETEITEAGEKKYRAKQIFEWLHKFRVTHFAEMTNLPLQLREMLSENFTLIYPEIVKKTVSAADGTIKYLFRFADGETAETVLMKYRSWNSVCLSSQAGCKMGCRFCASGIAGFVRNLTPAEILMQVYAAENDSLEDAKNIVIMGIGEPLDNFGNVIKFLKVVSHPHGRAQGIRRISVSTCGLVPKIKELADIKLGITLSVSLHAPDDRTRGTLMPVNKTYSLSELIDACRYYFEKTSRRIAFEYILIKDINDSDKCAENLAKIALPLGVLVNLIPANFVSGSGFTASSRIKIFHSKLLSSGVTATIRRTLGSDISAACGQLRGILRSSCRVSETIIPQTFNTNVIV